MDIRIIKEEMMEKMMRGNQTVDNRFVVPYCPGLLCIFNCHINVEVVTSVKSVKYLYKYVYKGYDAANIIVEDSNNERLITMKFVVL